MTLRDRQLRHWANNLSRDAYPCVSGEDFVFLDASDRKQYVWMGRENLPLPENARAAIQAEYDRVRANSTPEKETP